MLLHSLIHFFDRHRTVLGEVLQQAGETSERTLSLRLEEELPTIVESEHNAVTFLQTEAIPDFLRNGDLSFRSQRAGSHLALLTFRSIHHLR